MRLVKLVQARTLSHVAFSTEKTGWKVELVEFLPTCECNVLTAIWARHAGGDVLAQTYLVGNAKIGHFRAISSFPATDKAYSLLPTGGRIDLLRRDCFTSSFGA